MSRVDERPVSFSRFGSAFARVEVSGLGFVLDGIVIAIPFILAWWLFSGINAWPQNDDPFYGRPVQFFADDGRLQLVKQYGQLTASSVGHIIPAALWCGMVGFSYQNLFVVCLVQQLLGALAIYSASRVLGAHRSWSLLLALAIAACPLYFGHAFTFMTDGPATAWVSIACCLMIVGLVKEKLTCLVAASVAIAWGVWIRQTNVMVLTIPLFSILLFSNSSVKRWVSSRVVNRYQTRLAAQRPAVGLLASLGIAVVSIALLESGCVIHSSSARLDDVAPDPLGTDRLKSMLIGGYGFSLMAGWLCVPALPILWTKMVTVGSTTSMKIRRCCWCAFALTLAGLLIPFVGTFGRASITSATGTFIQNGHFGPIFMSDMDEPGRWGTLGGVAWPTTIWMLLTLLAIFTFACLAFWGTWTLANWYQQLREGNTEDSDARLAVACAALMMVGASSIAVLLFVEPLMDRYWLFLFPPILGWLILLAAHQRWVVERSSLTWAGVTTAAFLTISVLFTHDLLAWNNARWTYVTQQLNTGVQPWHIDGGRDVNAWLRMSEDPETHARPGDSSSWWSGFAHQCIAVGPRPGWTEVRRLRWQSWATMSTEYLLVLQRDNMEVFPSVHPDQELVQR